MRELEKTTTYIGNLKLKLEEQLEIPFYFDLPNPEKPEPLGVIGDPFTDNHRTAKTHQLIEDLMLPIDIYLPKQINKLQVNDIRQKAVSITGRQNTNSSISKDDSTNRVIWRIHIETKNIL